MALKYDFSGKTVLVTGGSRGIGFTLVESLAECGARVISLSRNVETLKKLKERQPKWCIEAIKCDVSKWDELNSVAKSLPHIDCLVNNAGLLIATPFGQITPNEIDDIFDTNVKAMINLSQVVTNDWKNKGFSGVVVNVSSQASKTAALDLTVYGASKAAIDGLTRSMALELGPFNIRVNSVNPTGILTDMGNLYFKEESWKSFITTRMPLRRLGEVQEAVDVIMYLISDRCTLVTGASIPVDGGFWAC